VLIEIFIRFGIILFTTTPGVFQRNRFFVFGVTLNVLIQTYM
jgi:hypothetical protein